MFRLSWLLSNSIKMAVPAGIYLAMNMLGFVSLLRDRVPFGLVGASALASTSQRILLHRPPHPPTFMNAFSNTTSFEKNRANLVMMMMMMRW